MSKDIIEALHTLDTKMEITTDETVRRTGKVEVAYNAQRQEYERQQGTPKVGHLVIDRPLCGDHLQHLPHHQASKCPYDIPHHRHQYTDGDEGLGVG